MDRIEFQRNVKRYFDHFLGQRIKVFVLKIKLWNLEVLYGSDISDIDDAHDFSDDLSLHETEKWLKRAWHYRLDRPPEDNDTYWYNRRFSYRPHPEERQKLLSNDGVKFILDQYRVEKGLRREVMLRWATFVFSAVAAIGVVVGFL